MKRILSATGTLFIALTCYAVDARAQTVANGTYYATPSWNLTLPVHTRFIVLANFNQEAVLDRETGLVWEREPGDQPYDWISARFTCAMKVVGNRSGWRLPTVVELGSLATGGHLPPGHPFVLSGARSYWSATVYQPGVELALALLTEPPTPAFISIRPWASQSPVWCVRGGGDPD